MRSDFDSTVGAQPGGSGFGEPSVSRLSADEQSSTEAISRLVQQMAETNAHLLVLADQVSKCLTHVSLLLDLLVSEEEEEDEDTSIGTYLDGTPIL